MKILLLIILLNLSSVALFSQTEQEKSVSLSPKKFKERMIKQEFPDVPQSVREHHGRGEFLVLIVVNKDGNVKKVKVIRELPDNLTEYLEKTIANWKFKPLEINGERVSSIGAVKIPFCYGSFSSWCLD